MQGALHGSGITDSIEYLLPKPWPPNSNEKAYNQASNAGVAVGCHLAARQSIFVNPTGCHTYCTYLIAYLLTWAYVLYQYAHASAENAITYKKK